MSSNDWVVSIVLLMAATFLFIGLPLMEWFSYKERLRNRGNKKSRSKKGKK